MATIGVGTNSKMRPRDPSRLRLKYYPEHGTPGGFEDGDLLILTSGKLQKAGSDPSANTIIGIAAEAQKGVADSAIGVLVATTDAEFIAHVESGQTTAVTQVGTGYGIVLDGTYDVFRVDISDTTNKRVIVTEILDQVGDTNGRVVFKFQETALAIGRDTA